MDSGSDASGEAAAGAKLGELRRRAKAAGVPPADIETAIDEADDPKAAVIELIVAAEAARAAALEESAGMKLDQITELHRAVWQGKDRDAVVKLCSTTAEERLDAPMHYGCACAAGRCTLRLANA